MDISENIHFFIHRDDAKIVFENVEQFWDLSWIVPVPRSLNAVVCPGCRSKSPLIRKWQFHEKPGNTIRHRCDVSWKCRICSLAFVHGVVIHEAMWVHAMRAPWGVPRPNGKLVTPQDVKKILAAATDSKPGDERGQGPLTP